MYVDKFVVILVLALITGVAYAVTPIADGRTLRGLDAVIVGWACGGIFFASCSACVIAMEALVADALLGGGFRAWHILAASAALTAVVSVNSWGLLAVHAWYGHIVQLAGPV